MADILPFRLHLTGDTADENQFQGYDGYMALAGFALTLSLIANFAETGEIRWRGDFPGRHAVRAFTPEPGSFIADFKVWLEKNPAQALRLPVTGPTTPNFFYELVRRVIGRNIGNDEPIKDPTLQQLIERREGDVESLVARTEAPIRQAHSVIGNGALSMDILGGFSVLGNFNEKTRDYVKANIEDPKQTTKNFTVNAFAANSGNGGLFDPDLHRSVPFSMSKDVLVQCGAIFSWGLDQYVRRTSKTVRVTYTRILAMDGTPKKYIVLRADANDP